MTPYEKLKTITKPTNVAVYRDNRLIRLRVIDPNGKPCVYKNIKGLSFSKCCWFDSDLDFSENIDRMFKHDQGRGMTVMILSEGQEIPETLPVTQSEGPNGIIETLQARIAALEQAVRSSSPQRTEKLIDVTFLARDGFEKRTQMSEREIGRHVRLPIFHTNTAFYEDPRSIARGSRAEYREFQCIYRDENRAIFAEVAR